MKGLGASLLLIALLSAARPAGADTAYKGTLDADQPFGLSLDASTSGNGKTTVTVTYYLTGGRPATKFDVHVVAPAARETISRVIPTGTSLIAIELAPPSNVAVEVEAFQGLSSYRHTCVGGCTLTFDVQ